MASLFSTKDHQVSLGRGRKRRFIHWRWFLHSSGLEVAAMLSLSFHWLEVISWPHIDIRNQEYVSSFEPREKMKQFTEHSIVSSTRLLSGFTIFFSATHQSYIYQIIFWFSFLSKNVVLQGRCFFALPYRWILLRLWEKLRNGYGKKLDLNLGGRLSWLKRNKIPWDIYSSN